jgi:hypothetical protein
VLWASAPVSVALSEGLLVHPDNDRARQRLSDSNGKRERIGGPPSLMSIYRKITACGNGEPWAQS